jgi:hypothetical protein
MDCCHRGSIALLAQHPLGCLVGLPDSSENIGHILLKHTSIAR